MGVRAAKWIFWGGTLSSLALFLVLTVDTHAQFDALTHADRMDAGVVAGKRVFEKYNCNDCHTILGFGAYYAPDLTKVVKRLGADSVRRRIEQPEVVFASSWRKMPNQGLSPEETTKLVSYLAWVGGIENHDWPPQDSKARWKRSTERLLASATVSPAAALVNQENCLGCHSGGEGNAPTLELIGSRRDAAYVLRFLEGPDAVMPGTGMPSYARLSPGQREMIADFVVSLGR